MRKLIHLFALLSAISFTSCDDSDPIFDDSVIGPDISVFGLTSGNNLVSFNAKSPSSFTSKTAITGVTSGEKLLSIDFRPATGELYAVSDASKLYVINTTNAQARMIGTTPFSPAISGSIASIDFNPTVDRIRLVTNTGQNLRIHPETGVVAATDGTINGGTTAVVTGIAYTNSKSGATSTTLFDVDGAQGKLYKQDPPNNGTLVEVGNLGFSSTAQIAFDINFDNSIALIAAQNNSNNILYLIDTNTGKTSAINKLQEQILDLAIPTESVAYAVDNTNNLQIFNPNNPSPVSKAITGLQTGENVLGIDFRPLNGQLYALGSSGRLYTLNLGTGAATMVGTNAPITLTGTDFGFDFNPTVDRIRIVSNLGQNLRVNPIDGSLSATDGMLNPGTPAVSAAAYTNNFAGATTTSLFVIDHNTDKLYQQNPPNNGTLVEIGNLGVNIVSTNGFDIGSNSQKAYLIGTEGASTKIFTVNTSSGMASNSVNYPNAVKAFALGLGF